MLIEIYAWALVFIFGIIYFNIKNCNVNYNDYKISLSLIVIGFVGIIAHVLLWAIKNNLV